MEDPAPQPSRRLRSHLIQTSPTATRIAACSRASTDEAANRHKRASRRELDGAIHLALLYFRRDYLQRSET